MDEIIVPVILAGGSGSRLWPVSRASYPKQFCAFGSSQTLFQQAVERGKLASPTVSPVVIGNYQHRFIMAEQLRQKNVDDAQILLEPIGRDSAAAIISAAFFVAQKDPNAVLWIMPSDSYIDNNEALVKNLHQAARAARQDGSIVLFGVKPTSAHTGYGYIEQGKAIEGSDELFRVGSFCEKPPASKAEKMLQSGHYYWNAGMFIATAKCILSEAKKHTPELYKLLSEALAHTHKEMNFRLLNKERFEKLPSISFDYAIVEKTSHVAFIKAAFGWSDLGTWDALWEVSKKDQNDNVTRGNVLLQNAHQSYVKSGKTLTVLNNVRDLVVVTTPDAVLVSDRHDAQGIKALVASLKSHGCREGIEHSRMYRPWGFYETLIVGERFKVKYIQVKPGGKLSLQKHFHRAEHWVVVAGTALVTGEAGEKLLMENESVFLPAGTKHRLENPGKINLVVIEIQSGAYLGEDDIVRFQDIYSREVTDQ